MRQWLAMEILLTGLGLSPLFAARPLLSLVSGWVMLGVLLCLRQGQAPALGNVLLAVTGLVVAVVVESALKAARRKVDGNVFSGPRPAVGVLSGNR